MAADTTLTFGSPQFNLSPRADDRARDPDLVHVAAAVYNPEQTNVGVWSRLTKDQLTAHGIEPERLNNKHSGFKAGIYTDSERHALVFAGTDVSSLGDWVTNLRQGVGLPTEQYREAVTLAKDAREAFGDTLILTGHSLGGGLATAASAATQTTAVTFNPAGVHANTYQREGIAPGEAKAAAEAGQVRNYVVAGEVLDAVQSYLPIPKAVGQVVVLPDPAPMPSVLRMVPGAKLVHGVSLHGMAAVETAFAQHAKDNPEQFNTHATTTALHPERRDAPGRFAQAVYRLETEDGREVFMRVSRSNACNDQRSVVEVDADRLAKLCFPDPATRTPVAWRKDGKFPHAVEGFKASAASPVPLPDVACREETTTRPVYERRLLVMRKQVGEESSTKVSASFVDGTTRTMWLLANGVKRFPVECSTRAEAELLQRHAGAQGSRVRTVDELLPERREARASREKTAESPPDVVSAGTLASARAFAAAKLKPADQDRFVQRTAERLAADRAAGRQPPQVELRDRAADADQER